MANKLRGLGEKLGLIKADNAMVEIMKNVWQQLEINLDLSDADEAVCETALQSLFRPNYMQREAIESAVLKLTGVLSRYLAEQWGGAIPERSRKDIVGLAEREGVDKNIIAVEWIVQKTIMGMMEVQFMLKNVEEFDAVTDNKGYILFTQNGSIVIAEELQHSNQRMRDMYGKTILTGSVPIRNATYLRIPSRKTGKWATPQDGKGPSTHTLKVGERGRTPIVNTSDIRQILVIPEDQSEHLKLIIEVSRVAMSELY